MGKSYSDDLLAIRTRHERRMKMNAGANNTLFSVDSSVPDGSIVAIDSPSSMEFVRTQTTVSGAFELTLVARSYSGTRVEVKASEQHWQALMSKQPWRAPIDELVDSYRRGHIDTFEFIERVDKL